MNSIKQIYEECKALYNDYTIDGVVYRRYDEYSVGLCYSDGLLVIQINNNKIGELVSKKNKEIGDAIDERYPNINDALEATYFAKTYVQKPIIHLNVSEDTVTFVGDYVRTYGNTDLSISIKEADEILDQSIKEIIVKTLQSEKLTQEQTVDSEHQALGYAKEKARNIKL